MKSVFISTCNITQQDDIICRRSTWFFSFALRVPPLTVEYNSDSPCRVDLLILRSSLRSVYSLRDFLEKSPVWEVNRRSGVQNIYEFCYSVYCGLPLQRILSYFSPLHIIMHPTRYFSFFKTCLNIILSCIHVCSSHSSLTVRGFDQNDAFVK